MLRSIPIPVLFSSQYIDQIGCGTECPSALKEATNKWTKAVEFLEENLKAGELGSARANAGVRVSTSSCCAASLRQGLAWGGGLVSSGGKIQVTRSRASDVVGRSKVNPLNNCAVFSSARKLCPVEIDFYHIVQMHYS